MTNPNDTRQPAVAGVPEKAGARRRIFIVEDHPVVSRGLTHLLNAQSDFQVIGTATSLSSPLEQIIALKPDLVITEVTPPGQGGLDLVREIKVRDPQQAILVLSMHDEMLYAGRAVRVGASGYIMKEEPTDVLLMAIRQIFDGRTYLSKRVEKQAMRHFVRGRPATVLDPLEALTDRELEIFEMIGTGKSTQAIAHELSLSVKTVETYRHHLKDKLSLHNGSELVQHAILLQREAAMMTVAAKT